MCGLFYAWSAAGLSRLSTLSIGVDLGVGGWKGLEVVNRKPTCQLFFYVRRFWKFFSCLASRGTPRPGSTDWRPIHHALVVILEARSTTPWWSSWRPDPPRPGGHPGGLIHHDLVVILEA